MNNLLSQSFNFSQLPKVRDSSGLDGPPDLEEFNTHVAEAEALVAAAQQQVRALRGLHESAKTLVKARDVKQAEVRLQNCVAEASRQAKAAKDCIQRLQKSNEANCRNRGCHKGSSTDRHRTAVTRSLARTLKAVLEDFQGVRANMDQHQREMVAHRVHVLTGQEVDESELESIMQTGRSEDILRQAMAQQGDMDMHALRDAVQEIELRSSAVAEISRSLQELHQLMVDMALLVESQQELLDQVEVHVGEAHKEAEAGAQQLTTAVQTRRNTRKWVCVGVVLVIIIVLIIAVPIVIQSLPKK